MSRSIPDRLLGPPLDYLLVDLDSIYCFKGAIYRYFVNQAFHRRSVLTRSSGQISKVALLQFAAQVAGCRYMYIRATYSRDVLKPPVRRHRSIPAGIRSKIGQWRSNGSELFRDCKSLVEYYNYSRGPMGQLQHT